MADLEQVVNDLNLASQSLQELREKYDGALDLLDNKNTQITGALDSAKSNALQEIQTISDTATSQISQLKDTSLNLVNEAKNTATTEISNKKEEHKQELETKKNEYINKIDAKANEYDIANINAQVKAMDTKITQQINGAKTELNSKIDNKVTKTGDETIAGVKTFSVPPVSATNPTVNNQVANKSYVDTVGNSKVALSGNQTIAGVKTFSVPPVSATNPTVNNQVANKSYVDTVGNSKVALSGNQTIAGVKTFSSSIVIPNATANNHATNLGQLNSKVAKTGDETIAGIKTFSVPPVSATNPTANNQVANKAYVDSVVNAKANANAVVALTGNQTIAGVKTFSSPVVVPNATANTHAVNLTQLNTKANANATVNLTGNQTIAGVKTFSVPPVSATNPTEDAQLARKWYVDYGGGIKNLGNQTAPKIDLRQAQHFILTMTARGAIGIANWGGAGKSGTITVNNAQNITAFSAPFKFRVAQSGFSGTETFAYFCIASNNVILVRT
ncbi:hypothetical protein FCK73_01385 [Campylobacter coli]|uniref:hypothetical protein n=1 Tax=Campylobacter coli TaxID=195 RepID=UPI0010BE6BE2|nr:hypothetical protein [Campylobacter coli]TKE35294.1 hypothetical protein FCK73_01385 [Campylobacter coli]